MNNADYFSYENSVKYMSVSQFKAFTKCESQAFAELNGDYEREVTSALLVGSYVDAYFEGTLDVFKANHPEILLKNGSLRAEFVLAETMIERVCRDSEFMKYMDGEKQRIFTGEIAGVQFKGKLDVYHEGRCIVDLKTVRSFDDIWENGVKLPFVEAWGYDIQGAVYQELVYQNTGEKLPFVLAVVTKEKVPDIALLSVPQERLDTCLEIVKCNAPHFQSIKNGEIQPENCGKCDYCKSHRKLCGVIDYRDLI